MLSRPPSIWAHGFGSVQFRKFVAVSPVYCDGDWVGVSPSNTLRPVPPSNLFAREAVKTALLFASPPGPPVASPRSSVSFPDPHRKVALPTNVTGAVEPAD